MGLIYWLLNCWIVGFLNCWIIELLIFLIVEVLNFLIVEVVTLFSAGGGIFTPPPCRIFLFSIEKRYQRGVKVVCKIKFGKLLDNKKDFRSKIFFGAKPRALKVEWVANFRISKSWLFYFYLKILPQMKDSIPSFLTQHLEWPVSVHMQKKWGEFDQKWPS